MALSLLDLPDHLLVDIFDSLESFDNTRMINQAYHDRLTSIAAPFYRKLLLKTETHEYIFSWSVDGNTNSLFLVYCHRRSDLVTQIIELLEPAIEDQVELAEEEGIHPNELDIKIQIQELPDPSVDARSVHIGPCGLPDHLPAHPNIIIEGDWEYVVDRLNKVAQTPHGKTVRFIQS